MNKKPNSEFDAGSVDYQEMVDHMESVVDGLPGMPELDHGNKRLLRLMHAMIGIGTESGELADQFKRHIFYLQPLDETNVVEELGDLMWYIGLACNVLGVSIREVQEANIRKLQKRYPDKFTVERAVNRDTEAEIKALVGGDRVEVFDPSLLPPGVTLDSAIPVHRNEVIDTAISPLELCEAAISHEKNRQQLVYLACPKSHPQCEVRQARSRAADHVARELMKSGIRVFSPLSHCSGIGGRPLSEDEWRELDLVVLRACTELAYIPIDGWETSVGVQSELKLAKSLGMKTWKVSLGQMGLTEHYPYLWEGNNTRNFKCSHCLGILSRKLVDSIWASESWLGKCPECEGQLYLPDLVRLV